MESATSAVTGHLTLHPPLTARQHLTRRVKALALDHGLSVSAVTSATSFPEVFTILRDRIDAGHMAGLDWFTTERAAESCEPKTLMADPLSILSVGIAYWGSDEGKPDDGVPRGRISRYARGRDYHEILPERMRALHAAIEELVGYPVASRFLTDHARIVDRAVAARAGLGWYGKNACIIVPGHGSWVMLGELLLDLDLEPDQPLDKNCGRCHICLDQCPTGAIVAPYTIHTPSCISFQTIEQRRAIPRELRSRLGDWVFGCDVCQDVCPYTRAAADEPDAAFLPSDVERAYPSLYRLLEMSTQTFREQYRGTAVMRARRAGLARNAAVALGNIGTEDDVSPLTQAALGHDLALVRGHAAWALGRIGGSRARRALARAWERERDPEARTEIELALEEAA
ncbi:MAG: tRNA epoxyqueuosine(34) reductase QueG [Chloroflexi bacterium]|nr:tRNA epoxyqueuosine(34) reductase QueG [Chloroflexota bacterium]